MRTLVRIAGAFVSVAVITCAVYLTLQSLPASSTNSRGPSGAISASTAEGVAVTGATAGGQVSAETRTRPSGGGSDLHGGKGGGVSLVQGLSQILLTLVQISMVASVIGIAAAFASQFSRTKRMAAQSDVA